jgi:3-deoxy-manno-octulosonate cytidylyltransferase (CMP-KDO synthetase)
MAFKVIIPARWASTRLPGKMLADLAGAPMVIRVAQQVMKSQANAVLIATDHADIAAAANSHNIPVMMTRQDHASGTDRLAEVVTQLDWPDSEIIVNVQGDEPLIDPQLINEVASTLAAHADVAMATAAKPMRDSAAIDNPNVVKVVCDLAGRALYFSRSPLPFRRNSIEHCPALHHIGLYAYRCSFLRSYSKLTQGLLEQSESLEQLRVLEHGFKIQVAITQRTAFAGVDTIEDLRAVRAQILSQS